MQNFLRICTLAPSELYEHAPKPPSSFAIPTFCYNGELAQKNPSYGFEGTNIVLSPPFIQVWKPKKIYM